MDDNNRDLNNNISDSTAQNNDFEFVTQTIKKRPINKKKVAKKVAFTVLLAVIFGLVSTMTFVLLYPRLLEKIYPQDNTKPVTLPVANEEIPDEPVEEFVPPNEDEDSTGKDATDDKKSEDATTDNQQIENDVDVDDSVASDENENGDLNIPDTTASEIEAGKDKPAQDGVVINQVVETIEKTIELDDYRDLLRKISAIAINTEKSLVTVSGKTANTDWFNNEYEDNNTSTGLIVAENGKELLIVSPTDILHAATNVDVSFNDGTVVPARIKISDVNTGLSIVSVELENIPAETMEAVEMAEFGSIAASAVGIPVVAVGSPYGVKNSMSIGQITSNSIVLDKTDSNVRMISTDIYGSTNASGVIVNYNGRIIGIICHEMTTSDMPNLIRAYSAEDITQTIEKMSNGERLACFGIMGTDVTKEANESYGVPYGAYVKAVVDDSPAMNAGIRNGDVIIKFGLDNITSFEDYKKALLDRRPNDVVSITLERPIGDTYAKITYDVTLEALR